MQCNFWPEFKSETSHFWVNQRLRDPHLTQCVLGPPKMPNGISIHRSVQVGWISVTNDRRSTNRPCYAKWVAVGEIACGSTSTISTRSDGMALYRWSRQRKTHGWRFSGLINRCHFRPGGASRQQCGKFKDRQIRGPLRDTHLLAF